MKRLNSLYEQFQTIPSIETHFQIQGYTFEVNRLSDTIFHFHSKVKVPTLNLELPDDILRQIEEYLTDVAQIQIQYPQDYPFKCPKFSLVSGKPTYDVGLSILNYGYDRDWSPAITFEKDILNLIQYII